MKRNMLILAASLMVAILFPATGAMAGDWYVDVFGGVSDLNKFDFETALGTIDTDFDTGYVYGLSVGRRFDNLRVEGELSQRTADVKSHALAGAGELAGAMGKGSDLGLMVNLLYDFRRDERVSPYVGAGVGYTTISLDTFGVDAVPDVMDDDSGSFAFQGIVGTSIAINDNWDFRTDVRYFNASTGSFTTSAAAGSVSSDIRYETLNWTLGLRYSF